MKRLAVLALSILLCGAAYAQTVVPGGGGAPTGAAGGDLSGTYPNPTVGKTGGVAFGPFSTAATGQAPAVSDASSACNTCVGYTITSTSTVQALTTSTALSVNTLSIPAGSWIVSGNVCFDSGATTSTTLLLGMISTNLNSISGSGVLNQARIATPASVNSGGTTCLALPTQIIFNASTTNYYLNAFAVFTASTLSGYGSIIATRIR